MADNSASSVSQVNRVVLPGDVIGSVADFEGSLEGKNKIKLGPGLREENGLIVVYKAGIFRHRSPSTYLIDCNQRRVSIIGEFLFTPTIPCLFLFFFHLVALHGTISGLLSLREI